MKKGILKLFMITLLSCTQIISAASASAVPEEDNKDRASSSRGMNFTVSYETTPENPTGILFIEHLEITRFFFKVCTGEKDTDAETLRRIKYLVQNNMKFQTDVFYLYIQDCKVPKIENCLTIRNLDTSEEPVLGERDISLSDQEMEEINEAFDKKIWTREQSCLLRIYRFKMQSPPRYDRDMRNCFVHFLPDNMLPSGLIRHMQIVNLRVLEEEAQEFLKSTKSDEHEADQLRRLEEGLLFLSIGEQEDQLKTTVHEFKKGLLSLFAKDQTEVARRNLIGQNLTPIEKDFHNWCYFLKGDIMGDVHVFFLPPQCNGNAKIAAYIYMRYRYFIDYRVEWKGIHERYTYFYTIGDIELFNKNFFKQYRDALEALSSSDSVATSSAGA